MICLAPTIFFLAVWWWIRFLTRFPRLTVRDVYPFFHRIEGEILVGSFHPGPEDNYRAANTPAEFRKWQWRRIHLAMHLSRDISANSRLLQRWAVYERHENWDSLPAEIQDGLREFQLSCMHSRTAAFAVRFRLRLWLIRMNLLPMLPVPSFSTIVEHSNTLIRFYRTAEVLADAISRIYGEEIHQNMLQVLGMLELELDGPEV
jgi:hypothetical protein